MFVLRPDKRAAQHAAAISADAEITQSIPVLQRRLEALGVRGATVTRQGLDRIVVETNGKVDLARLRAVLTQPARLTFQLVDDSIDPATSNRSSLPPYDELVPDVSGRDVIRPCGDRCVIAVKRYVFLTGDMVEHAQQGFDPYMVNWPVVEFRLTPQGARRLAEVTRANVGRRFAIIVDTKMIEAPVIETPITGGEGVINGAFTVESASDLAAMLMSGQLPVPLIVVQERHFPAHA